MPSIKLDSVHLINFLSYKDCVIDFKDGIYPIIGSTDQNYLRSNGAGKTAIAEAIYWCLYGKPLRKISVDELINSSEGKNCRVSVSLTDTITNRTCVVSRYRKDDTNGNSFKVEVTDYSGERYFYTTQENIDEFVGMDDVMFANSVMFGRSDKLALFSKMSDGEKKEFIRKICPQLRTLEEQNDKYRTQVYEIKQRGAELDSKRTSVEGKLSVRRDMIAKLSATLEKHKKSLEVAKAIPVSIDNSKLESELANIKEKTKKLDAYFKSDKYKHIEEQSNKYEQDINELQAKIIKLNSDLSAHRRNVTKSKAAIKCPTCNRPFDNAEELYQFGKQEEAACDDLTSRINNYTRALHIAKQEHLGITAEIRKYKEAAHAAMQEEKNILAKMQANSTINTDKERAIASAEANINNTLATINEAEYAMQDDEDILASCQSDIETLKQELAVVSILEHATSSVGLQAYIADSFLADVEHFANNILQGMSDSMSLSIISGKSMEKGSREGRISITVDNPNGGLTYGSTSSGESARVDFAIMFGVVSAIQQWSGSNFNFMFLDESFDNAVDDAGAKSVIDMLKQHILPWKESIYITSHRSDIKDLFDNTLIVNKQNGVSVAYYG